MKNWREKILILLKPKTKALNFSNAVFQIVLIDMVFSFDSVITAGGTAKHVEIMIAAVITCNDHYVFF